MKSTNVTLSEFAENLSGILGRTVVDKTGLSGKFNLQIEWSPDATDSGSAGSESPGPSLFTAIQEQMGLRLESQRGQVDLLIIDGAQKPN
jgi:uncharacterized protein (TIGR03435 family)